MIPAYDLLGGIWDKHIRVTGFRMTHCIYRLVGGTINILDFPRCEEFLSWVTGEAPRSRLICYRQNEWVGAGGGRGHRGVGGSSGVWMRSSGAGEQVILARKRMLSQDQQLQSHFLPSFVSGFLCFPLHHTICSFERQIGLQVWVS